VIGEICRTKNVCFEPSADAVETVRASRVTTAAMNRDEKHEDQKHHSDVAEDTIKRCDEIELDLHAAGQAENEERAVKLRDSAKEPSTARLALILGGLWVS